MNEIKQLQVGDVLVKVRHNEIKGEETLTISRVTSKRAFAKSPYTNEEAFTYYREYEEGERVREVGESEWYMRDDLFVYSEELKDKYKTQLIRERVVYLCDRFKHRASTVSKEKLLKIKSILEDENP